MMYAITWNWDAALRLAVDWTDTWHLPYDAHGRPDGSYGVGLSLAKRGAA